MGVNSKLFVIAKREAMLDLMPKLIKDLNEWQRAILDVECKKQGLKRLLFMFTGDNRENWSNGLYSITTTNFESFSIVLKINGETRDLFITHTCSNNYSDTYEGDKIIFSLGRWGMDKDIMMVIAESVKEFGDVYFCENDCEGEFEKLELESIK